jgi:hypothetical protein
MHDPTDSFRRAMIADNIPQADLARHEGQTWDTGALRREFEVLGFLAPFVCVKRKADGKTGTLEFVHQPRVYFDWKEDPS